MGMDPVCKMTVDEEVTEWTFPHKGKDYHFCSRGCREEFQENPEFYLAGGVSRKSHCSCCGP
jgi:Cu+-exporting ATPase